MSDISLPHIVSSSTLIGGRYSINKQLGSGSQATVHRAVDTVTGTSVALKCVTAKGRTNELPASFQMEIDFLQRLNHPNIVKVLDTVHDDEASYIVMEYVRCGTLWTALCGPQSSAIVTEEFTFRVFHNLVSTVLYLHSMGVYHRDIKLENILLPDYEGNIKLIDLGLAASSVRRHTACGSLHYMAPELHVRRVSYDASLADVWSLGIVLYCMVSKRMPFNDKDSNKLKNLILNAPLPATNSPVPHADEILSRMLEKDAIKRMTLNEIINHPYWLQGCAKYGLEPSPSHKDAIFTKSGGRRVITESPSPLSPKSPGTRGVAESVVLDTRKSALSVLKRKDVATKKLASSMNEVRRVFARKTHIEVISSL